MKALPVTLIDKLLLNARNMAETIIGQIKAFSSLNLPKHRAPINAFLHLLAALTAYQLKPVKPPASCFPRLTLSAATPVIRVNLRSVWPANAGATSTPHLSQAGREMYKDTT